MPDLHLHEIDGVRRLAGDDERLRELERHRPRRQLHARDRMTVASATMANDTPPLEIPTKASPVRSRRRQLIGGGVALVVIVATFFFVLPRIADYRDVWDVVKTLTWEGLLALAVGVHRERPHLRAALAGGASGSPLSTGVRRHAGLDRVDLRCSRRRGPRHGRLLRDAPRLGVQRPPGGARGDRDGRLEPARSSSASRPIALGLLTMEGGDNPLLKTMALVGSAVLGGVVVGLVVGFWSAQLARKVGDLAARLVSWLKRVVRRGPVSWDGEAFVRFREETIGLAAPALARAHARDARRPPQRLRRAARVAARARRARVGGDLDRGVRRVVGRSACSARCRSRPAASASSSWG